MTLFVIGVASPNLTQAQEKQAASDEKVQLLVWLKTEKYLQLDQYLTNLQRGYERGQLSEADLDLEYSKLQEDVAENVRYFDRWVDAYPRSYAARYARGDFFYGMSWASRGNGYIDQTTNRQIDGMKQYLVAARRDLEASLDLSSRPYLSALDLLNAAMTMGTNEERRKWLDFGNKIAPGNIRLRSRYMVGLSPKWGGSYQQMRGFLEECRGQHLPEPLLAHLDEIIHTELGREYRDNNNDAQSFDEWETVIELANVAGEKPTPEALIGYVRAAWDLGRRDEADLKLRELSQAHVKEGWILAQMGWIYYKEGRMQMAWPLLQDAAAQDSAWSELEVGKLLYAGSSELGLSPDPDRARYWLRRAAKNGNEEAKNFTRFDSWNHLLGAAYLYFSKPD